MVDYIRSVAGGLIFTTALPPAVAAAAVASVRHVRGDAARRAALAERAAALKRRWTRPACRCCPGQPYRPGPCRRGRALPPGGRRLLDEHDIYATPINYPTVPRGTERLRLCATPFHTDAMMDRLVAALTTILTPEQRAAA